VRAGRAKPNTKRTKTPGAPPVSAQAQRREHPVLERQRYLCRPANGEAAHRFTPLLSRRVVGPGDTCDVCDEPRCVHRGETTVARGHRYTTRIVAEALSELGQGKSYGDVSVRAFQRLRGDDGAQMDPASSAVQAAGQSAKPAKQRQQAWRLAADWTELFATVLWEPWAAEQQRTVLNLQARSPKDRERVAVIIDDMPVFSTKKVKGSAEQRFSVLAASECFIDAHGRSSRSRLRLLRAYPRHDKKAYLLLLNELGYRPDYIIADGGKGIRGALKLLSARDGQPFQTMLSAYHVRNQLRRLFAKLNRQNPGGFFPGDLDTDLELWRFCSSASAWHNWWERFQRRCQAQGVPPGAWQTEWVRDYKVIVDAQMPVLDELQLLPRTTGALESVLFHTIKPSILGRAKAFGNLARTNRLMDLMVLHANGQLNSVAKISEQLRADAIAGGGYAPQVRTIADPRMYRSLTDASQLDQLLRDAGLV
jgi:hypothetical protein